MEAAPGTKDVAMTYEDKRLLFMLILCTLVGLLLGLVFGALLYEVSS